MATLSSTIQLYDSFSQPLMAVINSVDMAVSAMADLGDSMNTEMDTSTITSIREELAGATTDIQNMTSHIEQAGQETQNNTSCQQQYNRSVQDGVSQTEKLVSKITAAVSAYATIKTVQNVLDISDELTSTTARLNMMNDGLQTTEELTNMVYAAAQNARGSFSDMAAVVAKFGNNAGDAFDSTAEVVEFAELVQKEMTIAGASTSEASNAMLQLSQALGSGVLRGDELNSIFEQAPNLIQLIADEMGVDIGQIREMASEGEITADIVKSAILGASDDINAAFEDMPMTWNQVWTSMQNTALVAFQPILERINEIANSEEFQSFVSGAVEALATLANIVLNIFDMVASVGSFIADNWSIISPIVWGAVAAIAAYTAALVIGKGVMLVMAAAQAIHTAATTTWSIATFAATVQQEGLNAALAACPITWIIVLIIALVALLVVVANKIAEVTGIANSGFGVITGGINVVIAFFQNLGLTVANIALGIGSAIVALASNMMTAFSNAISSIQSWFYNLLSTALTVVEGICEALNKLPFVEFDYSGISSAADDYANKAATAAGNKEDYTSISDAFSEGYSTFDTFQDGWASDAFNAGASWGDGIADAVSNFSLSDVFGSTDLPNVDDYTYDTSGATSAADSLADIAETSADTAGSAESVADSLDCTDEELKYLRDIAEQETVNRFTTAEITIEQTNNNNVSGGMDLDGVVSGLTDAVNEAVEIIAEGVHE